MALSQIQCLDDNNVNRRLNETKAEFFYSEEQRLALEALITDGVEAFNQVLKKENIREFLSELELKRILHGAQPCGTLHIGGDHGTEEEEDEEDEEGVEDSLQYWPMKSDCSIPELDLGWPDIFTYRGVTRASVYMQPPIDGQPHIKEVVRKMIVQAQKVIAVVMDMFTDVDIFKDMLDAGFKRRVGVYIILDETNVKYFLQMCERAQMHAGHLKNLRVRCTGGMEFFTRSISKFKGDLAQKFMFVDGDRAICGAYSFTWSAARTDRNVITVLTGQVVEAFDKQFQDLYLSSKGVSLSTVPMEDEPESEPSAQPIAVLAPPAPDVAKKLINPKYALVKTKSASDKGKASSDKKHGSKEGSNAPDDKNPKGKSKMAKQQLEAKEEMLSNIHPALQNMEKANMFDYLPTWVEPDPDPSEVLGYINIVDPNIKNAQPSQMNRIKICDTSQAMAQHMMLMKTKEQEAKQSQQTQVNNKAPPSPTGGTNAPKMPEMNKANASHKAPKSPKLKASQAQESSRPKTLEVPESPKPKTPESPSGAFALLASSQHLSNNENEAQDTSKNGKGYQLPVPKPRTVPVADLILKNNAINESQSKKENKSNVHEEENKIPVVNGLHKIPVKPINSPYMQNGTVENGEDEEDENDEFVTLSDQDSFSDCSSNANHYKSNASSVSEEFYDLQDYYRANPFQRRNSERIPNGEAIPLARQMSEGHISRGTFVSPLKISQSMQEMRQDDDSYMWRNKAMEDKIKHALERNQKQKAAIKGLHRLFSKDAAQRRQVHQFGSRAPFKGSMDHSDSYGQNQELHASSNYRDDRIEGYHHPSNTNNPSADMPRFNNTQPAFSARQHRTGTAPAFMDAQGAPDAMSTPFGIPYSKLSQSKHLKSRLGVHGVALNRRGH
ncbi:protein FAM83G isoform X2 [Microcaecilia unicolor]|uniref:Protein FAM83G isoform X2 n=1 Tax=Microcaecilia unicolor TaxID=1415580 RepID=A0A6P7YZR7_9AMPH|nr:protein FAM83G isoform X2 [Microcaecilia unicolor]